MSHDGLADSCHELTQLLHQLIDVALALERVAAPPGVVIPPRHERPACPLQPLDGPVLVFISSKVPARRAAQGAPHAFTRFGELFLQPMVERHGVHRERLAFGQHLKLRIDDSLDRPLAQEVRAEAVNRADAGLFEVFQCMLEMGPRVGRFGQACTLQLLAKPQLQLACRFFCEGDRDDLAASPPCRCESR